MVSISLFISICLFILIVLFSFAKSIYVIIVDTKSI